MTTDDTRWRQMFDSLWISNSSEQPRHWCCSLAGCESVRRAGFCGFGQSDPPSGGCPFLVYIGFDFFTDRTGVDGFFCFVGGDGKTVATIVSFHDPVRRIAGDAPNLEQPVWRDGATPFASLIELWRTSNISASCTWVRTPNTSFIRSIAASKASIRSGVSSRFFLRHCLLHLILLGVAGFNLWSDFLAKFEGLSFGESFCH